MPPHSALDSSGRGPQGNNRTPERANRHSTVDRATVDRTARRQSCQTFSLRGIPSTNDTDSATPTASQADDSRPVRSPLLDSDTRDRQFRVPTTGLATRLPEVPSYRLREPDLAAAARRLTFEHPTTVTTGDLSPQLHRITAGPRPASVQPNEHPIVRASVERTPDGTTASAALRHYAAFGSTEAAVRVWLLDSLAASARMPGRGPLHVDLSTEIARALFRLDATHNRSIELSFTETLKDMLLDSATVEVGIDGQLKWPIGSTLLNFEVGAHVDPSGEFGVTFLIGATPLQQEGQSR